ncbi:FKBP-type peptidyl-prolyl cis-trans isomerase [bacterium]|nr:FKBP-type peptidyl-prolyl cis-trans isomerase [bacterium]
MVAFDWDGPLAIEATDQFVSFKLFQNKAFPPGMHEALATMEPGERARLVLKSKKAYGGEDSPMVPIKLDAIKEPLQFEVLPLLILSSLHFSYRNYCCHIDHMYVWMRVSMCTCTRAHLSCLFPCLVCAGGFVVVL